MVGPTLSFTFEWEISMNSFTAFQFLQKGALQISYDATQALVVTFNSTERSFSSPSLMGIKTIKISSLV